VAFYVYILKCGDGSYYVGHTEDLVKRLAAHRQGEVPGYTHTRRPVRLAYAESFHSREEAFAAERRIKGWSRDKKEALIKCDWARLQELAKAHGSTGSP
jgi:predicted GIY-YIG superfamily endonuclease